MESSLYMEFLHFASFTRSKSSKSSYFYNNIETTLDDWIFNFRCMTLYIENSFQYAQTLQSFILL